MHGSAVKRGFLITLLILLGFGAVGFQSPSPTNQQVFQILATGVTSATYISAVGLIRNIGQPYHLMTVVMRDAPSLTCTQPSLGTNQFALSVIGGYSNSIGSVLPNITTDTRIVKLGGASNRFTIYAVGQGVYQSLRATFSVWDNVNCVADVYYTGTFYPTSIKNPASYPGTTTTFGNAIGTGLSVSPAVLHINSDTTTTLTASIAGMSARLYGLSIYSAASGTIRIQDSISGVNFITLTAFGGAGSAPYVLPLTGYAYFSTLPSGLLQVVTTGTTTSTDVTALYAYE